MNTGVLMKALLKPQKILFICVHLWLKKIFKTLSESFACAQGDNT